MPKVLLITGATGKQGGSVIDSILSQASSPTEYTILAVTRDANSSSAQKLASKSPSIKLVEGNLDDVPGLFRAAREIAKEPIWGVYSVQVSIGKGVTHEGEIVQGKAMVDESVKQGVKYFVYSSVDRGGDEKSWDTPTPIPHFISKHEIEHYLRERAGDKMGWTILRPVAFMDNLEPGFPTKVFVTALRDTLGGKPVQWVATSDIGVFAAKAFANPQEWNHRAISLAGDELNFEELSAAFKRKTGQPMGTTFWILGTALMWGVREMGTMLGWFASDGYAADIQKVRGINPDQMDMETWIEKRSKFQTI